MDRIEPVLVPEWSRTSTGTANSGSNTSYQNKRSSSSIDDGNKLSSTHRASSSLNQHDVSRSYSLPDRTLSSSLQRGKGLSNGSINRDKNSTTQSLPYGSFNKSQYDRGPEKDLWYHERDNLHVAANGYCEHSDTLSTNWKDVSRQTQSVIGRRPELWTKKLGNGSKNGVFSTRSSVNGLCMTSFERDFPSLGAKEKHSPTIQRISSPGPVTAVQSLPLSGFPMIGSNGWTSALVDVPSTTSSNGPIPLFGQQSTPACFPSTASSINTGLNMAETLTQAPTRAHTPQLSVEIQKLEELTIKQSRQLVPVTSLTPKASAVNSEKLKPQGARTGDMTMLSKVVQLSSQSVNHNLRGPREEVSRTSQIGNFQVLQRDRNSISASTKEALIPTDYNQNVNLLSASPSVVPKLKTDGNPSVASLVKSSSMEKIPSSQVQNRLDFFNTIRNSRSSNRSTITQEQHSGMASPHQDVIETTSNQAKSSGTSSLSLDNSGGSSNIPCKSGSTFEGIESIRLEMCEKVTMCSDADVELDEEEKKFMRSLGWEDNAGEDALTAEEIDAFNKKYRS